MPGQARHKRRPPEEPPVPDLILHHYDLSPFAEKVRLAFGLKGLAWRSVDIPVWPPRPDTVPLTAGYRRVPVLQVGADVYCDTLLILREVDRRFSSPGLFPGGSRALAAGLSSWWDVGTFLPAAKLVTSIIGDHLPEAFLEDRIAFMGEDFSRSASLKELPRNRQRVAAQMTALSEMLGDGRRFLLGDAPSAADLTAYHTLWFVRKNGGAEAEALLPFAPLLPWMERIAALGHGTRADMAPAEALEVARSAEPEPVGAFADDASGLEAGAAVSILSDGGNDPIRGTLAHADADEIVIRHEGPRTGAVHVHFPRLGYSAVAA
ncbi:glutathione S-transferase family protein [Lichenibacterium minor]|uniref:Glutathione S-transferase family protein n=1 Tax=Lichenibacterium minor TaxID=2316528 RepID=A0A4Q2UC66_9HYPH|nr:glutathione S-transferase family protein [Lichenibacterium minor]